MTSKLKISDAGMKGRGAVAKVRIARGESVLAFHGKGRWIWDIPKTLWEYAYQVDYDRYIIPRSNSYGWFLNHSCNPNCGIRGQNRIVSMREIAEEEEVTIDHSTNVGWDGFAMECHCGEKNCRGTIRGYRYLIGERKKFYGRLVSPYLLKSRKREGPTR